MIPRYTRPEMGWIWSDQNKFQQWLEVELAASEALAELGVVPADAARLLRDREARRQPALLQRLRGDHPYDRRVVVLLAEMPQHQVGGRGVEVLDEIVRHPQVREMPHPAHDALLHAPGVGADFQHVEIVIRFEQQQVRAPQVEFDGLGNVAEVRDHPDAHALRGETEAHRVDGVVRDAEALDCDIVDLETRARLKWFQARGLRFAPVDGRRGQARQVHDRADVPAARQHGQPSHMIGMLVGDDDGVDRGEIFADGRQPPAKLLHAQPGIHQDTRIFSGQQGGVPGTAACQHAELNRARLPLTLQNTPKHAETGRLRNVWGTARAAPAAR